MKIEDRLRGYLWGEEAVAAVKAVAAVEKGQPPLTEPALAVQKIWRAGTLDLKAASSKLTPEQAGNLTDHLLRVGSFIISPLPDRIGEELDQHLLYLKGAVNILKYSPDLVPAGSKAHPFLESTEYLLFSGQKIPVIKQFLVAEGVAISDQPENSIIYNLAATDPTAGIIGKWLLNEPAAINPVPLEDLSKTI